MSEDKLWDFIVGLDDDLLKGGVIESEYTGALIRSADLAFVGEAWLACIITSIAVVESYLRSESKEKKQRLVDLIDSSGLGADLISELHELRRYRNSWVHVSDPWNDDSVEYTEENERRLEEMARRCLIAMRKTVYSNQWI